MKNITLFLSLLFSLFFNANHAIGEELIQAQGQLEKAFSSWGKASLQGDWKIVSVDGRSYIELAENFKAKEGPDVKIFLSPASAAGINGKNAADDSLFVHLLDDFEGSNRIPIPEGVDLTDYKTLVFHCEAYSKLWGVSSL